MRFLFWAAAALFFGACGEPRVTHDSGLQWGDVGLGEARAVAFQLTNSGGAPAPLRFSIEASDFSVEEATRTLQAGETSMLMIRFTPTELGPRSATLSIRDAGGAVALVALSGRGTGARISVPSEVILQRFPLVTAQEPMVVTSKVVVRNTGTAGSLLTLGVPRVDGAELCVGAFNGASCEAWTPPAGLETQTLLEVPLSLRATSAGARQWIVTFPSNDLLRSEVAVTVRALVESFEPCFFSAPQEIVLGSARAVVSIRHLGSGTCLLQAVTASSTPADFLTIEEPRSLPLRLESNQTFILIVGLAPSAPLRFTGVVQLEAAGTSPVQIAVKREAPASRCLVMTSSIDLGTVPRNCSSPNRNVMLYNACAEPLVIDSVSVVAGAGEAPQGPNCPGTAPCPEFTIVSGLPSGTIIPSGGPPQTISVKYRPINYGADTGAIQVSVRDGGDFLLSLQGRGDTSTANTDAFRNEALPAVDVLVMLDTSPSFVPRRANTRANLMTVLNRHGNGCFDARWAFAPADGSPTAGVQLQPNDAGAVWTSSSDPAFVERALSAFDSLPVGSEDEACAGPAADLIADAGRRSGAHLSGICVTDALEHSANPTAALQRLQSPGSFTWSAIAGYGLSCGAEAQDDGVHAGLVASSNGVREDICNPNWAVSLLGFNTVCSPRTTYFLNGTPEGPLEVRVDGVVVPSTNYTLAAGSVTFQPGHVPGPGTTIEISYTVGTCLP